MAQKRLFFGNVPKDGYSLHTKIVDENGDIWAIYNKTPWEDEWRNFKLVFCGEESPLPKANYWLTWNTKTQSFRETHDLVIMRERRPDFLYILSDMM